MKTISSTSSRCYLAAAAMMLVACAAGDPRSSSTECDTAADVAFCSNHPGYEKAGDRVVSILAKHGITTEIMYYIRQEGLVLPTDNKAKAEGFLVLVNIKNASVAKSILKRAIEDGLPISLLGKSILNPSKSPRKIRGASEHGTVCVMSSRSTAFRGA